MTPNGDIIGYTVYVNYSDGSPISSVQTTSMANYTLSNLMSYQLVSVRITARTSAGEGPSSELVEGRTQEEGKDLYL